MDDTECRVAAVREVGPDTVAIDIETTKSRPWPETIAERMRALAAN